MTDLTTEPAIFPDSSKPKPIRFPPLIGLVLILPLLVGAVKLQQRFSSQAISPDPAKVLISPIFAPGAGASAGTDGLVINPGYNQTIHFSAQAVDEQGSPIPSGVTYLWGFSSTDSIGNFVPDPNQPIASFTPSKTNYGLGDIWIRAVNRYGTATGSIKVCVGVPCPTTPVPTSAPTPAPVSWKSRTAWFKADYLYFSLGAKDVGERIFTGRSDPGTITKIDDVSTNKLAVSWIESGTPLTLSIFYESIPEFDGEKTNYAVSSLTISDEVVIDTYRPVWTTRAGYPFVTTKEEALLPVKQSRPDLIGVLYFKNIYWFPGLYPLYDLDYSNWSWKHVQKILPTRIMPPVADGLFAPTQEIARSDMALFLVRTYEYITQKKAVAVDTPFTDIGSLSPEIQDAIKKIYGLKVTAGTSATTYSPEIKVNRAQIATFLSNLYKAITGDYAPEVPVPFTDIYNEDIKWAQKPISRIYGLKITAGISPTEFGPYLVTTREQMATFIMNFIEALNRVSIPPFPTPTPTPTPTPPTTPLPTAIILPTGTPTTPVVCAQVLTPARNLQSGECATFPTACLPDGWVADASCAPSTPSAEELVQELPQPTTPEEASLIERIIQVIRDFFAKLFLSPKG